MQIYVSGNHYRIAHDNNDDIDDGDAPSTNH